MSAPELPPPQILALTVDETGTSPHDIERTQELIKTLVAGLPEDTLFVVASFSGEKRIVLPATSDRSKVAAAIAGFTAGRGGVALADGLFDVVQYVASQEAKAKAILMISAGRSTDGDLNFDDPLDMASSKKIPIFTLGLGRGDGRFLRRIAKLTGGEYARMEVADGAMLVQSMLGSPGKDAAERTPVSEGAGKTPQKAGPAPSGASGGLIGAAALFFALGALLMVSIVVLLVRRMNAPPAEAPTHPSPGGTAQTPGTQLPKEGPGNKRSAEEEIAETLLEKTMVVNANPTLRALSGPGAGKDFPLLGAGSTSLGRSRSNDIVVPEDAASARHCRIDREGDSYVLYDLGATNGSWVNGAKVSRSLLQHGDRLKIGETVFTVSLFGDRT